MALIARLLWTGFMLASCCGPVLAAQADTVVVENSRLRLVFAARPVPFLRELVQKPSGKNLIAEPASQNLFSLEVRLPQGGTATIESQRAREGSIKVTRVAKGQCIEIQFAGLGPAGEMRVRLDGRLDDGEPLVRWSIAVDNPARQALTAVRFPYVAAAAAIGSADDDFLIGPALPGVMIENPAKNWPDRYSLTWRFPGDQSAQFCSYQDREAGVYLASMDTDGHGRSLSIAKRNNQFVLCQEYQPEGEPAAQWKSPYETALGVTSGSWQQTADLYKRWAAAQPWCARTLAQRDDIPAFWKEGPCIHTCEVRTYDDHRLGNGSYYPKLQEHLRALRERIGGPVAPMLPGWENYRRWTAGAYFPIFDAERAKNVLGRLRQDGFHPFVYLSGLYYTFQNEGRDGGNVPGWERYAASLVIDAASGKPKSYELNESTPGAQNVWIRHSYQFCPAAPGTREFFCSVIDQLHGMGIDMVQMDQTTSGAGDACYSPSHGHQPGRGSYQSQAFAKLLGDLRRHGQALSPEFMLTHEEPHEELIPYLDAFHTREYRDRGYWYRSAPGARGIPLFTYLYHEYAMVYGGEGPNVSAAKNPAIVRELAINLVTGKTPAVSVWSNQNAMATAHADQMRMLRHHMSLLKTEAQRFLILGRMLHPLEVDVTTITLKVAAKTAKGTQMASIEDRAVLTSSWQSPEGAVGHCLVNISDVKQRVRLALDTRNAQGWPRADVDLYRADNPQSCEHLLQSVALPRETVLELAPLEAVFLVVRPANGKSRG